MNSSDNLYTDLLNHLNDSSLVVIDSSAIVNIKSADELDIITEYLAANYIKVAVGREFYENFDIILKSSNEEHKYIIKKASSFLQRLEKNDCLFYMSDFINPEYVVKKLISNPNVCFIYYRYSNFAENVSKFGSLLECTAMIVDENGAAQFFSKRDKIIKMSKRELDKTIIDDCFFSVSEIPECGSTVKDSSNVEFTVGKVLGNGGEGIVYECSSTPEYAIKIYRKGQLNKLRLKKIFNMEKKKIMFDGICWPEKVIFNSFNEPVGYIMKKAKGQSLDIIFDGVDSVCGYFPYWKKSNVIRLVIDVLEKIQYLHLFGIIIGDLRLKNIVIDNNGTISLVDIDSCQVENLPCPTGFHDYTPPELQQKEFKETARKYYHESFACSVIAFKLLFYGIHPYDQINGAETIEEEIIKMSFPYPIGDNSDFSKIPWGNYDSIWRFTPVQMQNFFFNIFKNGKRYCIQEMILMMKTYLSFNRINDRNIYNVERDLK